MEPAGLRPSIQSKRDYVVRFARPCETCSLDVKKIGVARGDRYYCSEGCADWPFMSKWWKDWLAAIPVRA